MRLYGHLTESNTPLNDAEHGERFVFDIGKKTHKVRKTNGYFADNVVYYIQRKKQAQVEEKVCDIYQLQKWQKNGMSRNVV